MIVASDGSGDFTTIQEAVDRIPDGNSERVVITVKNGIYKEKLHIRKPYVSLIGESADRTIVTYDDYARKKFPNGEEYHTFHSYTVFIGADHFCAENITFENAAGSGELVGQALAAYVDGDCASFKGCRFLGHQDTLFTGPLPEKPKDRATFGGPREGVPRRKTRQYYERCFIKGDVDFIFGSATAVFHECEIFSGARPGKQVHGWITAASTPENSPFGYVFIRCRLTGNAPPHSVYLGRPWRNYAKVAFIGCELGEHIAPAGWDNWNKPESEPTTCFGEYASFGPGAEAARRVDWAEAWGEAAADTFAIASVLAGADGWNPLQPAEESARGETRQGGRL
jgi:pectinesterase